METILPHNDIEFHKIGHVYILSDENRGLIKIGRSKDPEFRLNTLKKVAGLSTPKEYISHKISDCHDLEYKMHQFFNESRISGEWFNATFDKAVSHLKSICPKKISAEEIESAKKNKLVRGEEIFSKIQSRISNSTTLSSSEIFLESIVRLEEIYAFENSLLHAYGAISQFFPSFDNVYQSIYLAKNNLEKSIELLSKAVLEIHLTINSFSQEELSDHISFINTLTSGELEELSMDFKGKGSNWLANHLQEHAA